MIAFTRATEGARRDHRAVGREATSACAIWVMYDKIEETTMAPHVDSDLRSATRGERGVEREARDRAVELEPGVPVVPDQFGSPETADVLGDRLAPRGSARHRLRNALLQKAQMLPELSV